MRKVGFGIAILGPLFHAYIALFKLDGGVSNFTLQLLAWSSLPYVVALLLVWRIRRPMIPLMGVIPPLVMDVANYYSVFIRPTSSTAAIGLLWIPLWNLVLFMPAGLFLGWAISNWIDRKNRRERE